MERAEQIRLARQLLGCGVLSEESAKAIKADFPELAESEDERARKEIRDLLVNCCEADRKFPHLLAWLEKHKEQPAEWSEEDAERYERVLYLIDHFDNLAHEPTFDGPRFTHPYTKEIEWLKSLRPQPHWKPSEEQLSLLQLALNLLEEKCESVPNDLWALYDDLKKLM